MARDAFGGVVHRPEEVLLRALSDARALDFEAIYRGLYSPRNRLVVELLSAAEIAADTGADGDAASLAAGGVACLRVPEADVQASPSRVAKLILMAVKARPRDTSYRPHWYDDLQAEAARRTMGVAPVGPDGELQASTQGGSREPVGQH